MNEGSFRKNVKFYACISNGNSAIGIYFQIIGIITETIQSMSSLPQSMT